MVRPRARAAGIAVGALLAGWIFLAALARPGAVETRPYVEAVGFAISTPAGLAFLTYLAGVFRFEAYYEARGGPALFGDFFLAVLAAAAAGLPATALVLGVTDSTAVPFVVSAFVTFMAAFVVFVWRTREYFDWAEPE